MGEQLRQLGKQWRKAAAGAAYAVWALQLNEL